MPGFGFIFKNIKMLFFLCKLICVNGVAENNILLKQKLCNQVNEHIKAGHKEFIPTQGFRQIISHDGGNRRKNTVVAEDFEHSQRYIGSGFKGEAPVECEVPKHAQDQGC